MLNKISAFQYSGTWELILLPYGKFVVGCKRNFAIKVGLHGTIDCLKVCLVTNVVKIASILTNLYEASRCVAR